MRTLLTIAWRNLGRNRRRTILTTASVVFASVLLNFMMAFQAGSYSEMIDNACRMRTGHMQVQNVAFLEDPSIENTVPEPLRIVEIAGSIPHVRAATPRAEAGVLISCGSKSTGGLVTGIDPSREVQVTTLAALVRQGRLFNAGESDAALLGTSLAESIGAGLGDEIVLLGQAADGSIAAGRYTVTGMFSSGMPDLDAVQMFIDFQGMMQTFALDDPPRAHFVALLLDDYKSIPAVRAELAGELSRAGLVDLALRDWGEIMPGLKQGIALDMSSGALMYLILLVVVAFGVMNTFVMIAFERMYEFGVMLAIGLRGRALAVMMLIESSLLTVLGIAIGLLLGAALTAYFSRVGIPLGDMAEYAAQWGMSGRMYPRSTPLVYLISGASVLLVSIISALYPAWRVTRFKPVEALRRV